jgi:hypothetical protein
LKLPFGENIEENQTTLLLTAKETIQRILRAAEDCPMYSKFFKFLNNLNGSRIMKALFHIASEEVIKKFPSAKMSTIGGFFFLRFLCPALVVPDGYGIIEGRRKRVLRVEAKHLVVAKLSEKSRRSLILLSKILQVIFFAVLDECHKTKVD